jgi:tRNA(Arg) A34 adenosine deaminase TadA
LEDYCLAGFKRAGQTEIGMRDCFKLNLNVPAWFGTAVPEQDRVYATLEERMRLAIHLAQLNTANGTGGPFGAAVFNEDTGTLVSAGVNLVVRSNFSIAHAEILAITFAQHLLGTFELGKPHMPRLQLVSSAEPCVMCFGALIWSGMPALVCGARDEDVRAIGFDEGAKTPGWITALERRGITVRRDVCRQEAMGVLREYQASGAPIYNATPASYHSPESSHELGSIP